MNSSSRTVCAPHLANDRFRRCPICQFIIDKDHSQALVIEEKRDRIILPPPARS